MRRIFQAEPGNESPEFALCRPNIGGPELDSEELATTFIIVLFGVLDDGNADRDDHSEAVTDVTEALVDVVVVSMPEELVPGFDSEPLLDDGRDLDLKERNVFLNIFVIIDKSFRTSLTSRWDSCNLAKFHYC